MKESTRELLERLSTECVNTYTQDDVLIHLQEEIHELGLALLRVKRSREPLINFIEEVVDVHIETHTVLTLIREIIGDDVVDTMLDSKLQKFESALKVLRDRTCNLGEVPGLCEKVRRYHDNIITRENLLSFGLNGFDLKNNHE